MKVLAFLFCLLCTVPLTATSETATRVRTFFLEGVRSGKLHGPFRFATGTRVSVETGSFHLDVLSAAGDFILTEEHSGSVFGVYALRPGRIIDAGYQLFTITRIASTPLPDSVRSPPLSATTVGVDPVRGEHPHDAPPPQQNYAIGIIADVVQQVDYDWKLDKQDGGRAKRIERRGATLFFSRGILTLKGGVLADTEWDEPLDDAAGRFQEGTISRGSGWIAGIEMLIPVFRDGRWRLSIGGGLFHQRESFDLEYGSWQVDPGPELNTNSTLQGLTNSIPEESAPIVIEQFVRHSTTATLAETWISLTAQMDYTAPNWFAFAGLRAFPWSATDLRATIEVENQRIPLTLKRKDPLSGYAGVGFSYQDLQSYTELEAGGVHAIRIGILLSF